MFRRYSIRSLLVATVFAALFCSVFAWRHHRLADHQDAMRSLQSLGAELVMSTTTNGFREVQDLSLVERPFMHQLLATPTVHATVISLVDPNISSDDVRKMIPHLSALVPSPHQESDGKPFLTLIIVNQTCMTDELRTRIKTELPHFVLSDFSDTSTINPDESMTE